MRRLLFAVLTVSACGVDMNATPSDPTGGGKADGGDAPTLVFASDFSESASGALHAGASMRVDYALDRITDCRSESGGSERWGVTGWAQFDNGTPVTFGVSRIDSGVVVPVVADVSIPRGAKHVQMWFSENDAYGCLAYDSNEGANYQFDIEPSNGAVVLGFAADFSETQSGDLHAGGTAVVHYDPDRLPTCQAESGGHAVWGITGHYQADGGAVHDLFLSGGDASFSVPAGKDLAMWFEATNIYGCHEYDSDFGANYHFTVR